MVDKRIGRVIGEGACSEVFAWEDGEKVLKLGKEGLDPQALVREWQNTKIAWDLGLAAPRPYEMVEIEGRTGIVFSRVDGETAMELLLKGEPPGSGGEGPAAVLRAIARALHEIHSRSADGLRPQGDVIAYAVRRADLLTAAEKEAVLDRLNALCAAPAPKRFCHGDPNPGNFVFHEDRVTAIDWMDASLGDPAADLADWVAMLRFMVPRPEWPPHVAELLSTNREWILQEFLSEYQRISGIGFDRVEPWIVPMAARRLSFVALSIEEKQQLAAEIRRRLKGSEG